MFDMMADVLEINYLIDPKVKGTVNLHMKGEIAKTDLLSLFDDIIRINQRLCISRDRLRLWIIRCRDQQANDVNNHGRSRWRDSVNRRTHR